MRFAVLAVAAFPLAIAACSPKPEPPAPTMSPAEEACSALALQQLGLTEGDVTVTPVASSKTGATIYDVQVAGSTTTFTCTVEIDNTVSAFGPG
ncbi:hypothetical protein [Amaricoccus sp.]|uniref:hypothetical protein n=1 Tax=Amaricoccus sp. TaxID=1872485 RepID=UPI001B7772B6|nr:hypothetical protein [Amaricoccus sp.]MBP7241435.1 hypothetical protein [Amaricoccus sp.]